MTELVRFHRFRRRYLALTIGLMMLPTAHAMQELSDHSLSDTTGEGVALVLDNFKMVFQGANDVSNASSYGNISAPLLKANATAAEKAAYNTALASYQSSSVKDTGFIRIIPRGENYEEIYNSKFNAKYQSIYNLKNAETIAQNPALNAAARKAFIDQQYNILYPQKYSTYYDQLVNSYWDKSNPLNEYQAHYNWRKFLLDTDAEAKASVLAKMENEKDLSGQIKTKITNDVEGLYGAQANLIGQAAEKNPTTEASNAVNEFSNTIKNDIKSLKIKADVFIYGLALSKSDGSLSTRFSNAGFDLGTAENPWLFRAGTEKVQQFTNALAQNVGYLALEAPLASKAVSEFDNNIKLGFWSDIFARSFDSVSTIDAKTGAPTSGLEANYRLRTQFIANGLSLNGSQVRMFQTLPTALNKDYGETLGIASIIRLNTNDNPSTLGYIAETGLTGTQLTTAQENNITLNAKGIRISTAAKANLDGALITPALGGDAPIFNDTEGLYLYSPNINLVLGNMYQPFILGSDGNNIVLEVSRIPNVPDIYHKIYQNYGGDLGSTLMKGSTCNVYACGSELTVGAKAYQGRDATHSSISIGTVGQKDSSPKLLDANKTVNATGVVFKDVNGVGKNYGSALIDGLLIQHLKIKTTGL